MPVPMNPSIFKAYDIRGIYGVDFDEKAAYKIGFVFAQMRKKESRKEKISIGVGNDMRLSSPSLKEHLIEGLLHGGVRVIDMGLTPTPTFYFGVTNYHYDGGIVVSASHNSKEYNGFKLVRERAQAISKDSGILTIRDMVISQDLQKVDYEGQLERRENVLEDQALHDLSYAHPEKIKPFSIVIDTANAMGALYFDALFKHLPQCEIIRMNWKLDGTFPVHEADPFKKENLIDLGRRIIAEEADLGIATDGDGDRIFFVDERGEPVEAGITRAILCRLFLLEHHGAKVVYDIRPGKITPDVILENGGMPIVERVGHSYLKERTVKEGAIFAGESSGHFFLNMGEAGCYEVPLIVTLKILEELSESGKKMSEYIQPFKRYFHSGEISMKVENPDLILQHVKEKYMGGKQSELDGISIEYPDFWFNVRKSNTEPVLRLTIEAQTRAVMEGKRDEMLALIQRKG